MGIAAKRECVSRRLPAQSYAAQDFLSRPK